MQFPKESKFIVSLKLATLLLLTMVVELGACFVWVFVFG